ncbi:MAG: ATP phosphoribosyltransferase [Thermoplasmata archaeon]
MKIVLPKGRLYDKSYGLLREAGINITSPEDRKLKSKNEGYELFLSKAFDVPVYVEHGIDIGIAGMDVYLERENDVLVPLELPFGKCRLSLAMPKWNLKNIDELDGYSIATTYVNIAKRYFSEIDVDVDIFKLNGSVELAPHIGISDAIVDIVESGSTLKANNLVEVHKLMDISALLLVNRISQKTKYDEINALVKNIRRAIKDGY